MSEAGSRGSRFPLRLDQVAKAPTKSKSAVLRPQAPLHQAHVDAARAATPSGLGLDSADVRRRMVQRLQGAGLQHDAVIAALSSVPRHLFVDGALATQAYEDTSLPIGHGQTISKPSVVGRMLELLMGGASARRSGSLGKALEVGTGCGYQAALLARLARQVVSVERLRPLHEKALALPPAWLEQLAIGGRLVAPLVEPRSQRQVLVVVDRHERGYEHGVHEAVKFVPLKSGLGN